MSSRIQYFKEKIKSFEDDIFIALFIFLAIVGFSGGAVLWYRQDASIPIEYQVYAIPDIAKKQEIRELRAFYMASKNGTKYYPKGCSSAKRIKPENVLWFESARDAEAAGYTPASSCTN